MSCCCTLLLCNALIIFDWRIGAFNCLPTPNNHIMERCINLHFSNSFANFLYIQLKFALCLVRKLAIVMSKIISCVPEVKQVAYLSACPWARYQTPNWSRWLLYRCVNVRVWLPQMGDCWLVLWSALASQKTREALYKWSPFTIFFTSRKHRKPKLTGHSSYCSHVVHVALMYKYTVFLEHTINNET